MIPDGHVIHTETCPYDPHQRYPNVDVSAPSDAGFIEATPSRCHQVGLIHACHVYTYICHLGWQWPVWEVPITLMLHVHHGIPNHWQFDGLLNSLFRLRTKKKIKALHDWVVSPHRGPVKQKTFLWCNVNVMSLAYSDWPTRNMSGIRRLVCMNISQTNQLIS